MSQKYNLTDVQLRHISIICYRESGNIDAGIRATASHMCNYYEKYGKKTFKNVYECTFGSGWYWSKTKNIAWVAEHPDVPSSVILAVKDVICNGNRFFPDYIDEYDCLSDITYIVNDGVKHTDKSYILNRKNYIKDKTKLHNRYADANETYTFYCFPDGVNGSADAFGYINKTTDTPTTTASTTSSNIPDKACTIAEDISADQSHGYSQADRWGPNFDCSSLAIYAYIMAGVKIDKTKVYYTGNLQELTNYGFKDVTKQVNLDTCEGMLRGDILYYHISGTNGHAAIYCGNKKIVHARGQSYGSPASGDQGTEIAITAYSRSKWQHVLRYTGNGSATNTPVQLTQQTKTYPQISYGSTGEAVKTLQKALNKLGYLGENARQLTVDGEFGINTRYAVVEFQRSHGLVPDGICGKNTWASINKEAKL